MESLLHEEGSKGTMRRRVVITSEKVVKLMNLGCNHIRELLEYKYKKKWGSENKMLETEILKLMQLLLLTRLRVMFLNGDTFGILEMTIFYCIGLTFTMQDV